MAPGIAMRIPYEPPVAPKRTTLSDDVQQLVKQKGLFHTINEENLIADLVKPDMEEEVQDATSDEEEAIETQQATRERLYKVRAEIQEGIANVQNHLLTLIDGLSLALSAHSRIAPGAMSPALKQAAPIGSIDPFTVEPRRPMSKKRTRELDRIATSTRSQALQSASKSLAAASMRLDKEAQNQADYWEQLAALRGRGWPISRLPNNDRALVVHYGSMESLYRDRGISVLQQDQNGHLFVPGQIDSRNQKVLEVTIHRKGLLTGRFQYAGNQKAVSQVEVDLIRARESLFVEELFTETTKEARLIANMGVRTRGLSIEVKVTPECSVSISHATQSSTVSILSGVDQDLAAFVGTSLWLMLLAEHRHRHLSRTQHAPPPLSANEPSAVKYALLRPLMAQLRHHDNIVPLFEVLDVYKSTMRTAGLAQFDYNILDDSPNQLTNFSALRQLVTSRLQISLPSSSQLLTISIETRLAAPQFGTQILESTNTNHCGSSVLPRTTSSTLAINHIDDILAKEIGCKVLSRQYGDPNLTWGVDKTSPLVLSLRRNGTPTVILAIRCSRGSIAFYCYKVDDKQVVYRGYWHGEAARQKSGDSDEQEISADVLDTLEEWIGRLNIKTQ